MTQDNRKQEKLIRELRSALHERKKCMLMAGYGLLPHVRMKDGTRPPQNWQELLKEIVAWYFQKEYINFEKKRELDRLVTDKKYKEVGAEIIGADFRKVGKKGEKEARHRLAVRNSEKSFRLESLRRNDVNSPS